MVAGLIGLLLIVPIILAALPFWTVALITRGLSRITEPRYVSWQDLIDYEPTIGWKPKPNLNSHYEVHRDDVFHVITDDQGWSGSTSIPESEILVFGDSFAFGYGTNAGSSFAEFTPSAKVKAIASNGYNMVQEALWMERLSQQLKEKLVVWFIFLGNDLHDNLLPNMLHYRMPFVRRTDKSGGWEIVTSHVSPNKWPFSGKRDYKREIAEICVAGDVSSRIYSACEFILERGAQICLQSEATLAVVTIPSAYMMRRADMETLSSYRDGIDFDRPDREIRAMCARLNVPFVAAKEVLNQRDYKRFDSHWSQSGHRKIGRLLSKLRRELMLEESCDRQLTVSRTRDFTPAS